MFAERMRVHEGRVIMRAYFLCERAAEFLELRPGDHGRGVLGELSHGPAGQPFSKAGDGAAEYLSRGFKLLVVIPYKRVRAILQKLFQRVGVFIKVIKEIAAPQRVCHFQGARNTARHREKLSFIPFAQICDAVHNKAQRLVGFIHSQGGKPACVFQHRVLPAGVLSKSDLSAQEGAVLRNAVPRREGRQGIVCQAVPQRHRMQQPRGAVIQITAHVLGKVIVCKAQRGLGLGGDFLYLQQCTARGVCFIKGACLIGHRLHPCHIHIPVRSFSGRLSLDARGGHAFGEIFLHKSENQEDGNQRECGHCKQRAIIRT